MGLDKLDNWMFSEILDIIGTLTKDHKVITKRTDLFTHSLWSDKKPKQWTNEMANLSWPKN